MHPYTIQAISAERVADWHKDAAASRLARQARLAARRASVPGASPGPIGLTAGLHRAWSERYREYWEASFDRLDAHLRQGRP